MHIEGQKYFIKIIVVPWNWFAGVSGELFWANNQNILYHLHIHVKNNTAESEGEKRPQKAHISGHRSLQHLPPTHTN